MFEPYNIVYETAVCIAYMHVEKVQRARGMSTTDCRVYLILKYRWRLAEQTQDPTP